MIYHILFLVLGFFLLIKGANWLVDGSVALAKKYNISNLVIGLTIVAFGTSSPELIVNLTASFQQHPDIVLGNILGSNNFNILAILGIAGIITPLVVQSGTVWKEIPFSFLAILILYFLSNDFFAKGDPVISRIDGLILLVIFALFLFYVFKHIKADKIEVDVKEVMFSGKKTYALIIFGLIALAAGGKMVVEGAIGIAIAFSISEKVIGLTILAAGTSLPELSTSVTAAFKKNSDIAVGNIIGSNIFNIFFIMASSALVNPVLYSRKFNTDLYLCAAGTLFLFIAMFSGQKKKLDRWEAAILVILFIGYTVYLVGKET